MDREHPDVLVVAALLGKLQDIWLDTLFRKPPTERVQRIRHEHGDDGIFRGQHARDRADERGHIASQRQPEFRCFVTRFRLDRRFLLKIWAGDPVLQRGADVNNNRPVHSSEERFQSSVPPVEQASAERCAWR